MIAAMATAMTLLVLAICGRDRSKIAHEETDRKSRRRCRWQHRRPDATPNVGCGAWMLTAAAASPPLTSPRRACRS